MDGSLTFGIDVGGTKLLGVALDATGAVVAEERTATPVPHAAAGVAPGTAGEILDAVEAMARQLARVTGTAAGALGVGVPGLVDEDGVLRFAPNLPGGQGLAIAQRMSERLGGIAVVVDNDATCAAVAEWTAGAAAGASHAVVLTLGTGIGGGIVAGGAVDRGAHGFAGEVGHMVVDPHGPRCPCGKRGCWERYASGTGLGRLARDAANAGRLPEVVRLAGGDPEAVRGEHVTAAAMAGDPAAVAVLGELAWWLALGLTNLAAALDPERFVLGGGLMTAGSVLLEPLRQAFADMVEGGSARPPVAIVPAALGERAGAVGAALRARAARSRAGGGS